MLSNGEPTKSAHTVSAAKQEKFVKRHGAVGIGDDSVVNVIAEDQLPKDFLIKSKIHKSFCEIFKATQTSLFKRSAAINPRGGSPAVVSTVIDQRAGN